METNENNMFTPVTEQRPNYIKVIGVGGGGGNAVNYMFTKGIQGVDFVLCNTDSQALNKSGISTKIHLGQHDLGAGNNPDFGREAAESEVSIEELNNLIDPDITKMVFITAGMGGGTGTGAAPVVAKIAKDKGILTVGIVTIPFECEGRRRKQQAEKGIKELGEHVDAIIVISNDKLREEYGNMILTEAFHKADEVLLTAAKGIAEIITVPGYINVDFRDVDTVMRNSGKAIMGMGTAKGENRAEEALEMALSSPLLNDNDITGAKNLLIRITSAPGENEIKLDEATNIIELAQDRCGNISDVIWGNGYDENLGESISITVIATGFGGTKNTITTHETTTHNRQTECPAPNTCATEKKIHTISFEPTTVPQNAVETKPVEDIHQENNEPFPEIKKITVSDSLGQVPIINVSTEPIHNEPEPEKPHEDGFSVVNKVQQTLVPTETLAEPAQSTVTVHSLDFNMNLEPQATIEEEKTFEETVEANLVHDLDDMTDDDSIISSNGTEPGNTEYFSQNGGSTMIEPQEPTVRKFDNMFGGNDNENDFEITSRLSNNEQVLTINKIETEQATIDTATAEKKTDPRIEQRNKLKSLSQFNFSNDQELSFLENVPAYLRRNKNIESSNNEDEMSRYSGSSEGSYSKNSYLHDNID